MLEYNRRTMRAWSMLGPSGAYGSALEYLLGEGRDVVALTADLRFYSGLNRISGKYPDRVINVGIAEQNLLGVAAGIAKEGGIPFVSTYAAFGTTRSLDQVRVSMGYSKLPIKLVGLSAGLNSSLSGPTHTSCGDLAIMRSIPSVTVLSPCDCAETVKAVVAAADIDGPVYIRLRGGSNTPMVYKEDYDFEVGKNVTLAPGDRLAIIATGSMVENALKAAKMVEERTGTSPEVINAHTIKPFDVDSLRNLAERGFSKVVTVEEHRLIGGLGDAVLDCANENNLPLKVRKLGVPDEYLEAISYSTLINQIGLSPDAIADAVYAELEE